MENRRRKPETSVAGSNIFFNSKHSLGVPTGSAAGVGIACAGRAGPETAACPLTGKLRACGFGADPFSTGAPREPAMLQKVFKLIMIRLHSMR